MILDQLLSFVNPTSGASVIDLGKEGALLMGNEYKLLIKLIGTVSTAGTWTLTTSDDNFSTSVTLASGTVPTGAAGKVVTCQELPFKPLAKIKLTLDNTNATFSNTAACLVLGPNHVDEMKNAKAA